MIGLNRPIGSNIVTGSISWRVNRTHSISIEFIEHQKCCCWWNITTRIIIQFSTSFNAEPSEYWNEVSIKEGDNEKENIARLSIEGLSLLFRICPSYVFECANVASSVDNYGNSTRRLIQIVRPGGTFIRSYLAPPTPLTPRKLLHHCPDFISLIEKCTDCQIK